MLVLAAVATILYALVNAFGAWMVSRRKAWIAMLFLLAASLLVIAFGALVGFFSYTRVILGAGLFTASLASLLNAQIVLGKIVWRFHALRLFIAIVTYLLAHFGLQG
jgi:hypothetical protein